MPAKAQRYGKLAQDETKAGLRARKTRPDSDSETEDESKLSEREIAKKKWVRRLRWAWRKLTAAFWVSLACFTIYYTNFFRVMWESPLVNRTYFYLAFACLAFNMSMLGYLALWCTVVLKIEEPWVWLFFFALWPVWGLLTLVIQLIFFLGFVSAGVRHTILPKISGRLEDIEVQGSGVLEGRLHLEALFASEGYGLKAVPLINAANCSPL
ncbi:hypothetical protein AK812_SmicGene38401 [Symbiodinium microadriaticum]|uniref:Transmembrane protein n=1 Tax=Symbiodinium microadriaticum TaxID=2951 RepID=A0A1Q9CDT5_SYMMI|nr:hypothetical protein AK812_SmicGene38401 [Symbiodinium microadriaticum]